jgi:hypothetical protein
MNTLIQTHAPSRSALRSTGVLLLSLVLTTVVLVALGSVVGTWA